MKNILALIFLLLAMGNVSAQCLVLSNCPEFTPVCDTGNNNPSLWNETYWFDPANGVHDLCDALTTSGIRVRDTCPGAAVTLRYLLFLDLDHDGTQETVIKSWESPAPGTVNFNNWNNPNYNGGELRVFDARPVATDEKYQFAIETAVLGDTALAFLRWNTNSTPGTFVKPELPYGVHKIKWLVGDNLGNDAICESTIIVKDCEKPGLVCRSGLAVNIKPSGEITIQAADFIQSVQDNSTPANLLEPSIRRINLGVNYPQDSDGNPISSLTFKCDELFSQTVDVWVRDAAGNADYCETYVLVQDNIEKCPGSGTAPQAPTAMCYWGLTVNILADDQVEVKASDFLLYAEDDNTPANLLEFGIQRCGSGTGFPEDGNGDPIQSLTFDCSELGTQCVNIWTRDQEGNADYCETYVLVEDRLGNCGPGGNFGAPKVVCKHGLAANIRLGEQVELSAIDFLHYAEDDNTAANLLEFGIRKTDSGSGFPVDGNGDPIQKIVFECFELGAQSVDIWARDLDGNADYCETYVQIQDNGGFCDVSDANLEVTTCASIACNGSPLTGTEMTFGVSAFGGLPLEPFDGNGCNIFPVKFYWTGPLTISMAKNTFPLNGVNVLDLVKIKRWILGLDTDLSPYAMIAADANKSGTITGFDIIELRKLILGTNLVLSNNTSWRFLDADYVFPNPQNPFQTAFPESITTSVANLPNQAHRFVFKAIKVGDLDCDASPGLDAPSQDRGLPTQSLTLPAATLLAGETTDINLRMVETGDWYGMQAELQFDPAKLEIMEVLTGDLPGLDEDAFNQPKPGALRFIWANEQAQRIVPGQDLLTLRVRALEPVKISEVFHLATDFEHLGRLGDEPQTLALDFRPSEALQPIDDETTILPPMPNPTKAGASLPLRLSKPGSIRIEISDILGKTTWSNTLELSAGSHLLDIEPQAMPQAGVYVWHVTAGNKTGSGKLVRN